MQCPGTGAGAGAPAAPPVERPWWEVTPPEESGTLLLAAPHGGAASQQPALLPNGSRTSGRAEGPGDGLLTRGWEDGSGSFLSDMVAVPGAGAANIHVSDWSVLHDTSSSASDSDSEHSSPGSPVTAPDAVPAYQHEPPTYNPAALFPTQASTGPDLAASAPSHAHGGVPHAAPLYAPPGAVSAATYPVRGTEPSRRRPASAAGALEQLPHEPAKRRRVDAPRQRGGVPAEAPPQPPRAAVAAMAQRSQEQQPKTRPSPEARRLRATSARHQPPAGEPAALPPPGPGYDLEVPPDVSKCMAAAQTRMLTWKEAATILKFTLSQQRAGGLTTLQPRPLSLPQTERGSLFVERPKIPRPRNRRPKGAGMNAMPDRWRNSGGSKGSSDLPKGAENPVVRRRYGAVLPAVEPPVPALRYYEYTLLDSGEHCEDCFLFHVIRAEMVQTSGS